MFINSLLKYTIQYIPGFLLYYLYSNFTFRKYKLLLFLLVWCFVTGGRTNMLQCFAGKQIHELAPPCGACPFVYNSCHAALWGQNLNMNVAQELAALNLLMWNKCY